MVDMTSCTDGLSDFAHKIWVRCETLNTRAQQMTASLNALSAAVATLASRLDDETSARLAADAAEAAARAQADTAEISARTAADTAEATSRSTADVTEAGARQKADSDEVTARTAADTAESSTRATADTALGSRSPRLAYGTSLLPMLTVGTPVDVAVSWSAPTPTTMPTTVWVSSIEGVTTVTPTVKSFTKTQVVVTVASTAALAANVARIRIIGQYMDGT